VADVKAGTEKVRRIMRTQSVQAVRQVLVEAAKYERFFDLSDAERLNWMIARAFQLGLVKRNVPSNIDDVGGRRLSGKSAEKRLKSMRHEFRSTATRRRAP
jgi:hypothetical protein